MCSDLSRQVPPRLLADAPRRRRPAGAGRNLNRDWAIVWQNVPDGTKNPQIRSAVRSFRSTARRWKRSHAVQTNAVTLTAVPGRHI